MRGLLLLVLVGTVSAGCLAPDLAEDHMAPMTTEELPANTPRPVPGTEAASTVSRASASEPTGSLTLPRALELADRSHPEIARALAELEAAGGRTGQAGAFPNPVAVARMESAPFEGRTTGEAEYVAGLSQRFPVGGRLSAAAHAGRLEENRLRQELAARRLVVHRRVHGAFATALYLDEVVTVNQGAVQITENGLSAARVRMDLGDALPEDTARAEIELERARLELERAQSLRKQAQAELGAAIGDPRIAVEPLQGSLESTLELPALEALSMRLGDHPALLSADADVAVERARLELAEVQRIPDINLDLFYRRLETSRTDAFDVGIAIPLPLFDRNQGSIREAKASVAAAEARSRSTRNELEREMRQAHTRLESALADARILREVILPRAEIVLQAFERRYAAGDASLTEVLPARREHTAMELSRLESLRQVMQAWSDLLPYLSRG
jgi:outer membrane protein, heavy metal efflux system